MPGARPPVRRSPHGSKESLLVSRPSRPSLTWWPSIRPSRGRVLAAVLALQPALSMLPAAGFELVAPVTDQEVSLVVGTGQLIKVDSEFSSLFVADPEVADVEVKSPRLIYLTGVGVGETTLFAVNETDDVLMSAPVKVTHNLSAVREGISRVAPGVDVSVATVDRSLVLTGRAQTQKQVDDISRVAARFVATEDQVVNQVTLGNGDKFAGASAAIASVVPGGTVGVTAAGDALVLSGSVQTPEQAANVVQVATQFVKDPAQIVNRMTVAAPTQVNLQVRIAEVNRNVDRQLGIRWGAIGVSGSGDAQIGLIGGGNINTTGGYGVSIKNVTPRLNVDVLLQALAEEGLVTVLAEPNLTARSGETANFLAGGEYPYATYSEDKGTTVQFKDYGVGLNFTPTVIDGNRISLRVATEVSDLSFFNNATIPSLISRRAETTVDLTSGQSFAIAGLMQNSTAQNAARMPGVGKLPVIGALFSSNGFKRGQTELVIIVTPVIVTPTTRAKAKTPIDSFVPPTDAERVLQNRFQGDPRKTNRVKSKSGERRLYGPSGFVFE